MKWLFFGIILAVVIGLYPPFEQSPVQEKTINRVDILIREAQRNLALDDYDNALKMALEAEEECKNQNAPTRYDVEITRRVAYALAGIINFKNSINERRSNDIEKAERSVETATAYINMLLDQLAHMTKLRPSSVFAELEGTLIPLENDAVNQLFNSIILLQYGETGEAELLLSSADQTIKQALEELLNWRPRSEGRKRNYKKSVPQKQIPDKRFILKDV